MYCSGVARVDQLPGHQVAFYKLNMKICSRDILFGGLAHTLVQIFKIMNIFARARPSIARASARVGTGLATPLVYCNLTEDVTACKEQNVVILM